MKGRISVLVLFVTSLIPVLAGHARAQTSAVLYPPGWSMVGGPAGSSFGAATAWLAFYGSTYVTPGNATAAVCEGYWAYFTQATSIVLATVGSTTAQQCPLRAGWTMVGNPFASPAVLPGGTTAYYWNATAGRYDAVSQIPVGGAVWILSGTASSIILTTQFAPTPSPTAIPPTITITDLSGATRYQILVGNTIQLLLPSATPHIATTDPSFLQLQGAGVTGPLSCAGDPSCAISLINQFWLWKATRPGITFIKVVNDCGRTPPPCAPDPHMIEVDIAP